MNPLLSRLHPYPFERLRELSAGIVPAAAYSPISLGIGEPRHATPALVEEALVAALPGLSSYPATAGTPALREAFAGMDILTLREYEADVAEGSGHHGRSALIGLVARRR